MMMKLKFIISLVVLCLGVNAGLWAQQDSTAVNDTVDGKKFFNALDYSMQKRYRPKNMEFANKKWADNNFVELNIGVEDFLNREGSEMGLYKIFSAGYGKMFTPVHGARVNLNGGWALHKRTSDSYMRVGLQASHLFNITAYMKGYNPSRIFELSTVLGLGYTYSKMIDKSSFNVGEIHAGIQMRLRLVDNLSLMLEPTIGLYSDGIDHYTKTNWHKYDVGYGAKLGLIYDINKSASVSKKAGGNSGSTFVSLAGGIQYQYSDIVREMGIKNSLGPHIAASAGKWFLPYLGVRGSLFYGGDTWNRHGVYNDERILVAENKLNCSYIGARIEAMVNVLEFAELDVNRWLAVSVIGGLEIARMNKTDVTQSVKYTYLAFTGGLQAKYKVNSRWGVFVEPRLSLVPYSYVPKNSQGTVLTDRTKYSDNIYNFNVGVEYTF